MGPDGWSKFKSPKSVLSVVKFDIGMFLPTETKVLNLSPKE